MKIVDFIKNEFKGYNLKEFSFFLFIFCFILYQILFLKGNKIAGISAFCGIMYSFIAGKGKISCFFFGLLGSFCYSYLSYIHNLWGNLILYSCYYIPMQILGIFNWKQNLKEKKQEIIKEKYNKKELIILSLICALGSLFAITILYFSKDVNPFLDGTTTFLSIVGMYLTVKRKLEQWIIWIIVNGLSFLMWIKIILSGSDAYSTAFMWGVYLVLSFYFYFNWKKEIKEKS